MIQNTQNKSNDPFLVEPLGRLLFKNATPAIAAMLMSALYQIIDGIMVGQRLGPHALASVTIAYPVIALLVGLAVMTGTGGNARIAVLLGRGRPGAARRVLSLLVAMGVVLGISGGVLVFAFGNSLTAALGAGDEIQAMALTYLLNLAPFFTTFILSFILEQSLRNDNRGGIAGAVMSGAAVLNIVLDYIFLFRLDLGIAGAALASGISMSIAAGTFLVMLLRRTGALYLAVPRRVPGRGPILSRSVRPTLALMGAIAANGSSELFSALAAGVVTLLFNRTLMTISGSDGVAAFAVVQYLLMLATVFFGGIAAGAQPIIGRNYGAGEHGRVRGTVIRMMGAGLVISVGLLAAGWFPARTMAQLFVPEHPAAIATAVEALRLVSWAFLAMPLGALGSAYFTAIERPVPSLMIAALRSLVLPVALLAVLPVALPATLGSVGIWLIPVASEAATALCALVLICRARVTAPAPAGLEEAGSCQDTCQDSCQDPRLEAAVS